MSTVPGAYFFSTGHKKELLVQTTFSRTASAVPGTATLSTWY